jgi:hypothetical protein
MRMVYRIAVLIQRRSMNASASFTFVKSLNKMSYFLFQMFYIYVIFNE